MYDVSKYKRIFEQHGGIMRTKQLTEEKLFYRDIQRLISDGYVEKVRTGYYQWIDPENFSEAGIIAHLFPDGVLCMDTAFRHYGYIDRTPGKWQPNLQAGRWSSSADQFWRRPVSQGI